MEIQIAATRELISVVKTQGLTRRADCAPPVENTLVAQKPQLARALTWLTAYPDRQGLSLRKAAVLAGVSEATLRNAIQFMSEERAK